MPSLPPKLPHEHGAWAMLLMAPVLGLAVALLYPAGWLPLAALIAFAPVVARAVWTLAFPPANLRAVGYREFAVAAIFLSIAIAAYRL